jgi:hypothetical protein
MTLEYIQELLFSPIITKYILTAIVFIIIDKLFLFSVRKSAKWFLLHFIGNMIIVLYATNDLINAIYDPLHALLGNYTLEPTIFAIVLHIHHLFFYTNISFDDIIHHFGFVLTLGLIAMLWSWGPATNVMLFFMCGLPGGLDYLLLALVKLELIESITEKKLNTYINLYIRSPGILFTVFLLYIYVIENYNVNHHYDVAPIYIIIIAFILMFINAQYYLGRVVFSYGRHHSK